MTALRVGVLLTQPNGFGLNFDAAWGKAADFGEFRFMSSLGYRVGLTWGAFSVSAGADAAVGVVGQRRAAGDDASSPAAGLSPSVRATWWTHRQIGLDLQGSLLAGVYQRDGAVAASFWPSAFLGVIAAP